MEYNSMGVAFYISSFLICMSCIVHTLIQNRNDKNQKKLFLIMLTILLFNTVTETINEILTPIRLTNEIIPGILWLCKYFYFLTHIIILPVLGYYVLSITGRFYRLNKTKHTIFVLPAIVVEILMLTNPIHNWAFTYNENFEYQRGWVVTFLYIVSVFYIFFFIVNIFRSWKAMTNKRRLSLGYFLIMVIGGIILQMLFYELRVELFAEAIAFLGVMLTIEDESDILDTDVGVYNRKALSIDIDNLLVSKQDFYVVCIKIENSDIIQRITGTSNVDILSKTIYEDLSKRVSKYCIYQTAPDTFVLILINYSEHKSNQLVQEIKERFDKSWNCNNVDVVLMATIMKAYLPFDFDNADTLFNMVDSTLPVNHKNIMIGKKDLKYILRRNDIESAIYRGLRNNSFEVYYQPTFITKDLSIHGAEALVRLKDEVLGMVFPDEFIPVAEQIGLIGDVDEFVLRSVCKFIASGQLDELGIESINVNLSVLQCIKPHFVEDTTKIVDEYNIDRSKISFEITESVDSNAFGIMQNVVQQFKDNGFKVYLDDYGTGYANVHALFSMDFDVIKIDKSILWGADKSELGKILLENNINMLKQMKMKILVEGVETENQLNTLKTFDVDYFQGYYFSRPIPVGELIEKYKK